MWCLCYVTLQYSIQLSIVHHVRLDKLPALLLLLLLLLLTLLMPLLLPRPPVM